MVNLRAVQQKYFVKFVDFGGGGTWLKFQAEIN